MDNLDHARAIEDAEKVVSALPAVICGHIALGQISRTGQSGRGLATAALVIGYAAIIGLFIFAVIAFVVLAR